MTNKATIEIDCDRGTVSVFRERADRIESFAPSQTTKAELIATILTMQSKELMAMSMQELMDQNVGMLKA